METFWKQFFLKSRGHHFKAEQFEDAMWTFWKQSFLKSPGHLVEIFKTNDVKSRWKGFRTGLLNVFMVVSVNNLRAIWRRFENGAYITLKIHYKRLPDDLIRENWRHYARHFDKNWRHYARGFMIDLRILNVNDLKALCRCFESDRLNSFCKHPASVQFYGLLLRTLSNNF